MPNTQLLPGETETPVAPSSHGLLPGETETPANRDSGSSATDTPSGSGWLHGLGEVLDAPQQLETGFVKGVGDTVSGISHLIHKIPVVGETLAPQQGIDALDQLDKSSNAVQSVGKFGENVAEFAVGDEALTGLSKALKLAELADKIPAVNRVINAAHQYPWLAKMISETTKVGVKGLEGATVGGVQGAVKGAQQDNAVAGAEGGALGGGLGGLVGGGIEAAAGLPPNPVAALQTAIKPAGKLAEGFAEKAELALPRLVAEHAKTPITNLDELSDAAHSAANNLWKNEVIPQIQRHANEIIPGAPVADAIRSGGLAGDKDLFPEAADTAESFAKKFDGDMSLQQASDRMQSLNRKLSSLYKLDPASRYAATASNPSLEAMESAANELRDQISTKLESLGETDPSGLRKTYGALKTVERAAEKRAIVVGRAAPLNLAQQLATAGGALHAVGHLAVGDVPGAVAGAAPIIAAKATKVLNSPEHLIGSALNPEGGALRALAQKAAMPVANIGSQGGQAIANESEDENQQ